MRKYIQRTKVTENPLWQLYKWIKFVSMLRKTVIIEISRYVPNVKWKRWMYRKLLHMNIGPKTAIAYKVVPDLMFPELITIGHSCVIGYNTTILTHEFLTDEFRKGKVIIGDQTLIGANVTILPGVTIGSRVKVGAGTIVSKDIPDDTFAYGNPMQIKR